MPMNVSPAGIEAIKQREGFTPTPISDGAAGNRLWPRYFAGREHPLTDRRSRRNTASGKGYCPCRQCHQRQRFSAAEPEPVRCSCVVCVQHWRQCIPQFDSVEAFEPGGLCRRGRPIRQMEYVWRPCERRTCGAPEKRSGAIYLASRGRLHTSDLVTTIVTAIDAVGTTPPGDSMRSAA